MTHLTSESAHEFEVHGVMFRSFVSTAAGATQLAGWCAEFSPMTPGVPHRMSREEVLYVLDGAVDVEVGEERFVAAAGDCVVVPPETRFRISNNSEASARAWVTTTLGMTATIEPTEEQMNPPWAQ